MPKPTPLILIGTGDYYQKLLLPALKLLRTKDLAYPLFTVDVKDRKDTGDTFFDSLEHKVRKSGENLSSLLQDSLSLEPVVILGHANNMHVGDTLDLFQAGFKVLVEKPFALTFEELSRLKKVLENSTGRVGLIEYYLTMKSSPLFALTGQLSQSSFFFEEDLMQANQESKVSLEDELAGRTIFEYLGKIKSVVVEVLEGEGAVGRLDHRGEHLIVQSLGGGMIQDLGIHAFAPLVPLERFIGTLLPNTISVKTERAPEYLKMAKDKFNLEGDEVAESYAEVSLSTSIDAEVTIRVGKYVLQNENRRVLRITGENGEVELDLSNPKVGVRIGEYRFEDIFALPKTEEKYYPVIRSSLLELEGSSPYDFSITDSSVRSEELVLETLRKA